MPRGTHIVVGLYLQHRTRNLIHERPHGVILLPVLVEEGYQHLVDDAVADVPMLLASGRYEEFIELLCMDN